VFTRPRTARAADTAALARATPPEYRGKVICKEDVGDAVAYALEEFDGIVCITGSFYTVGEAMAWLKINPYP
jgi:folylpolyglutamate synthase/dihydropteroate synthase